MDLAIAVGTILLSGLTAALVAFLLEKNFEKKRIKLELLRVMVGNRAALTPGGTSAQVIRFYEALNTAVVAFHDSPPVLTALRQLKTNPGRDRESFAHLTRAMCADLKLRYIAEARELIDEPFVPRQSREETGGNRAT